MKPLLLEIHRLTNGYSRKGGKDNRAQQRKRMLAFGEFCIANGAHSMGQVGGKHVIRYYRSEPISVLSDRTREAHYYAIKQLWKLAEKKGCPPKPFIVERRGERKKMDK